MVKIFHEVICSHKLENKYCKIAFLGGDLIWVDSMSWD